MPIQSKQQPPYYQEGTKNTQQYVALLTQTGTNAPVPTILKNDFNTNGTWSYITTGEYKLTITGAFNASNTTVVTSGILDGSVQGYVENNNEVNLDCYIETSASDDLFNPLTIIITKYNS